MKEILNSIALSIKSLSIDAIEKAKSGHPGMALGAAELVATLYALILKYNPKNPHWEDRDRFVLSAGHASMLLYSILHISGYPLTLDDIKSFRQVGSPCQGHPEYGALDGIEMTTGPLGQGIATAVGMTIAEKMLSSKFNTKERKIVDHYTYVLVGEGCLMEGISSEACSLAGTLSLNKLIVYYDANNISIDGSTDITFLEDVKARYLSYGWNVFSGSMYSYRDILLLTQKAKKSNKPSLIILKSIIGHGAPSVEGTPKAHGSPLGYDGLNLAKERLGLDVRKNFFVSPNAYEFFKEKRKELQRDEDEWKTQFSLWASENPEKKELYDFYTKSAKGDIDASYFAPYLQHINERLYQKDTATRTASKDALKELKELFPNIVGGSADLATPNAVDAGFPDFNANNYSGRFIHYGIREAAMAAITNGIALHSPFIPFCATFLVFSDYLRPALRLSSLMNCPAIYIFTHDSIFVGEDGATHQPIETLASLRAIPNLLVVRPADAEETYIAWQIAITNRRTPTVLVLSRQALPILKKEDPTWQENIKKGAYIVKKEEASHLITIIATGSEVSLALKAVTTCEMAKKVRVVSMLSKELFMKQPKDFRETILGKNTRIITVEAGIKQGWEGFVTNEKDNFSIEYWGTSGKGDDVAAHLDFTAKKLSLLIENSLLIETGNQK